MTPTEKPRHLIPALLKMKCPHCRKGNLFQQSNPFYFGKINNMNKHCSVCNQNFSPEPGFYFGGAVVSYPMMVIFNLLVAFVYYLIFGSLFDHVFNLIVTLLIASIVVSPAAFRYSRTIFIYLVIRYKPGEIYPEEVDVIKS